MPQDVWVSSNHCNWDVHIAWVCFLPLSSCCLPLVLCTGTTRILVTHQRQYLPKCDRIAVLRHGQLVACGPYEQVAALQLPELVGGAVTMSLDVPDEQQQQQVSEQQDGQSQPAEPLQQQLHPGAEQAAAERVQLGQQLPQQRVAGSSNSSDRSKPAGSSEGSEEVDPVFGAEPMLSHVRTMAPDINKRPADSGRLPAHPVSDGRNMRSGNSFVRAASQLRLWGSGFFQQRPQQREQAADEDATPESSDSSQQPGSQGSMWARLRHRAYLACAGLFTPPAYLPGGVHYSPPEPASIELPMAPAGYRAPSRKGLATLGPVRSMIAQPSLLFSSSGRWSHPAGIEPVGKTGLANGVAAQTTANGKQGQPGSSRDGAAAAAAASGQLVATEGREIGSVSWSVYGQYCKQMGLLTTVLLVGALIAGQGCLLSAEWWLALWSSSPPADQSNSK